MYALPRCAKSRGGGANNAVIMNTGKACNIALLNNAADVSAPKLVNVLEAKRKFETIAPKDPSSSINTEQHVN